MGAETTRRGHPGRRRALATLAAMPTATPTLEELAEALGLDDASARFAVAALERADLVETWPDPTRPSSARVMLSERGAAAIGATLALCGLRWALPTPRAEAPTRRPRGRPPKPRPSPGDDPWATARRPPPRQPDRVASIVRWLQRRIIQPGDPAP